MELNFEHLHLFVEGMKNTREQHAEESQSYEYGLNGRLYSHNGKLSYSSIKGTLPIYENSNIIKYLGFFSFPDELVVFVKYDASVGSTISSSESSITGKNVVLNIAFGSSQFIMADELTTDGIENINTVISTEQVAYESPLLDNYEEVPVVEILDLSTYYGLSGIDFDAYEICDTAAIDSPEYNKEYADAIIILKNNGYETITIYLPVIFGDSGKHLFRFVYFCHLSDFLRSIKNRQDAQDQNPRPAPPPPLMPPPKPPNPPPNPPPKPPPPLPPIRSIRSIREASSAPVWCPKAGT